MFSWNNSKSGTQAPAVPPAAADAPAQATPTASTPTRDQIAASVSKLLSAAIGEAVLVLARSPAHKHFALADIEWMVLPPVLSGQAFIAEAMNTENGTRIPVALVTWARVSPEVDRKLTEGLGKPIRLRPDEWTSGDIVWVIDAVGDARAVNGSLMGLLQGPLKDRDAKLVARDAGGGLKLASLRDLAAAAQSQGARQPKT